MTAYQPILAERPVANTERFAVLAADVRAKLATIPAGHIHRFEADRLLRILGNYEKGIGDSEFWAEAIAEQGLIRFGRNGYAPHIDGLVASAARERGL